MRRRVSDSDDRRHDHELSVEDSDRIADSEYRNMEDTISVTSPSYKLLVVQLEMQS